MGINDLKSRTRSEKSDILIENFRREGHEEWRGVNHWLEISGNLYKKSEISYAKCWSDLPLGSMKRSVPKSGPPRKKSPKETKRGPHFSEKGDQKGTEVG